MLVKFLILAGHFLITWAEECVLTQVCSNCKCEFTTRMRHGSPGVDPRACAASLTSISSSGFFSFIDSTCIYSSACPRPTQTNPDRANPWSLYQYSGSCQFTISPTHFPSFLPTMTPSMYPTIYPSFSPTTSPLLSPSVPPSFRPTLFPSLHPTWFPSYFPSQTPSFNPTLDPTDNPTSNPTFCPTTEPTDEFGGCVMTLVGVYRKCSTAAKFTGSQGGFPTPEACMVEYGINRRLQSGFFSRRNEHCIYHKACPENEQVQTRYDWSLYSFECPTQTPSDMPSSLPTLTPTLRPTDEPSQTPAQVPLSSILVEESSSLPTMDPTSTPMLSTIIQPQCPIVGGCIGCRCSGSPRGNRAEFYEGVSLTFCASLASAIGIFPTYFMYRPSSQICQTVQNPNAECNPDEWLTVRKDWSVYKLECETRAPSFCPTSKPSLEPTLTPISSPTLTPTEGTCHSWCNDHHQTWEEKCTWALSCAGCTECVPKPNIMLILVDDIGTGDVPGYWGNENNGPVDMPNIYSLTQRGVVFTDAHADVLCAPSRYSLLSGNYNHRGRNVHGTWRVSDGNQFSGNQKSLAQALKEGGNYHTLFAGKWHLGGEIPPNGDGPARDDMLTYQGYDWTLPFAGGPQDTGFDKSFITHGGIQSPPYSYFRDGYLSTDHDDIRWWDSGEYDMPGGTSKIRINWAGEGDREWDSTIFNQVVLNETIAFLDSHIEARADDPFFAHVSLGTAHSPFSPPRFYTDHQPIAGTYPTPFLDLLYEMDLIVGSLVQALEDRDLLGNTIIIFTSDNGGLSNGLHQSEQFGQLSSGPLRGYKGDVFEGGHRVPLIMRYDNHFPEGDQRPHLVGLNDIYATLCELANVPIPNEQSAVDSKSFASYIYDKHDDGDLREYLGTWRVFQRELAAESIRWNNFKLSFYYKEWAWSQAQLHGLSGQMMLHDLDEDISEENNLSGDPAYSEMIERMATELRRLHSH